MTAPLIAPVIPPSARPPARGRDRTGATRRLPIAAVPVIPAVPDDMLYGFGQIDSSGRVADRGPAAPTRTPPPGHPGGGVFLHA
jgi:hypothetical protein